MDKGNRTCSKKEQSTGHPTRSEQGSRHIQGSDDVRHDKEKTTSDQTESVAANVTRREEKIDLSRMNEADLIQLQKTDPFMYYSIPSAARALRVSRLVDPADILQPTQDENPVVARKTALSMRVT